MGNNAGEPTPAWLLRHANQLRTSPLRFFESLAAEFGDFVRFRMGKTNFHLVSDPETIKEILITRGTSFEKFPRISPSQGLFGDGLLTSEEPFHARQRRLAQPAFHRDRIASYAQAMAECAAATRDRWPDGATIDIAAEMNRLALAIVSRTLFTTNTDAAAERISHALDIILHTLNRLMLPPGPLLLRLPMLPSTRRYREALKTLDQVIYGIIAERRQSNSQHDDLLGLLMEATDPDTRERMSDLQLRDEVTTLFVAGHDTTANGLTWTWHLLSQHPAALARIRDEVRAAAGDALPTADHYPALTYTERVIAESMRLYPPVWILGRRPTTPVEIRGELANQDSIFLVCMAVLHGREALYPNPTLFDPDRFLPEAKDRRHRFAYLPFGAGSRLCIGERFAWMEMVLSIATIAQRWNLTPAPGAPTVEPLALLTLRPKQGLPLRVTLQ